METSLKEGGGEGNKCKEEVDRRTYTLMGHRILELESSRYDCGVWTTRGSYYHPRAKSCKGCLVYFSFAMEAKDKRVVDVLLWLLALLWRQADKRMPDYDRNEHKDP